jgi:hypothetical protein
MLFYSRRVTGILKVIPISSLVPSVNLAAEQAFLLNDIGLVIHLICFFCLFTFAFNPF